MIPPSPTGSSSCDSSITVIHDESSPQGTRPPHDLECNKELQGKEYDRDEQEKTVIPAEEEDGIIWVHWDSPDE